MGNQNQAISDWAQRIWYGRSAWRFVLLPLSCLFIIITAVRRAFYKMTETGRWKAPVPLIVVGNVTVGGTGKTPMVLALIDKLKSNGYRPGVVSRGYGGDSDTYPLLVTEEISPAVCGDEPKLISARSGCSVVVDPDRVRAVQMLLMQTDCNVVISDDGLQHYRLRRDIELVVVDGQRRLGNGLCLPAGPLREPAGRLKKVDYVVVNGESADAPLTFSSFTQMTLRPSALVNLVTKERINPASRSGEKVNAVAGIGNPQRFFNALENFGYDVDGKAFPDHHNFSENDFKYSNSNLIVMTEKDAVKCMSFAVPDMWYLEVNAELQPRFLDSLITQVRSFSDNGCIN